ncbi:MAG: hypothetical protein KME45_07020 [Stenomitos rutilans HA7619-LM2]|nr:hypothetical protein [Stenomitos rutilans HA7619-LM2]
MKPNTSDAFTGFRFAHAQRATHQAIQMIDESSVEPNLLWNQIQIMPMFLTPALYFYPAVVLKSEHSAAFDL